MEKRYLVFKILVNSMKRVIFIFFLLVFITSLILTFWLSLEIKKFEPKIYYNVPPGRSFIYSEEESKYGIDKYLRDVVEREKKKLVEEKSNFIYVDLKNMELTLYKEGEEFKNFPVKAKGADWFWGETPPGVYSVNFMSRLHFSAIAKVWMPYAIQYYGNYFIHGWPYDLKGKPLSSPVSGGCIRLNTTDAAVVFEFAKAGMPILIFEEKYLTFLPALISDYKKISPPYIKGESFLVADLDTGEILLSREPNSEIQAGSLVKMMLALTASENVNLEKRIIARNWMIEGEEKEERVITPGKSYSGYDLLSPLLSQSSNKAALVLSRFLTAEEFVKRMNVKAKGIGMRNTNFVDVTGVSKENITTLVDVGKMMRYIKDYRKFIFDIESELSNKEEDKETIFKIFRVNQTNKDSPESTLTRFIFIGIANSPDVQTDLTNILEWLGKIIEI
jgi:lipoprotein-anchoring transpeptidase ErfK/SrfK